MTSKWPMIKDSDTNGYFFYRSEMTGVGSIFCNQIVMRRWS